LRGGVGRRRGDAERGQPASFAKCRRENFPNIVISGQRSSIW
jgi:hypothetical protein